MPNPENIVQIEHFPNALKNMRKEVSQVLKLLAKATKILTFEIDIDRELKYKKDKKVLWKSQQELRNIHKDLSTFLNKRLY